MSVAARPPGHQRCDGGVIARGPEPDQLAIDCNLALHQRLGLFDQLLFAGIVLDGLDQCRERRQDRLAGLAVFLGELLIAGQCEAARRAFGPAQLRPHIGDFRKDSERAVDGSVIGPRLEVQTDRGSADDKEDSEANSKDDTLRGHCQFYFTISRDARKLSVW